MPESSLRRQHKARIRFLCFPMVHFSGFFRPGPILLVSCFSDHSCSNFLRSIDDGSFHMTIHTDHLDDIGVRDPRELQRASPHGPRSAVCAFFAGCAASLWLVEVIFAGCVANNLYYMVTSLLELIYVNTRRKHSRLRLWLSFGIGACLPSQLFPLSFEFFKIDRRPFLTPILCFSCLLGLGGQQFCELRDLRAPALDRR